MVKRFDVYLINLDASITGDARNTRPAVIISPDELNDNVDAVIVAPLSSSRLGYPTRLPVEFLNNERRVILDQLSTVDKARLVKKIGEIDERFRAPILGGLAELFA